MGGTPAQYSEMHQTFHAWMLSNGSVSDTATTDTYTPGVGGVQGHVTLLEGLAVSPYGGVTAFNPSAAGEIFNTKPPSIADVLLDLETYIALFDSEDSWKAKYAAIKADADVDASAIDPTNTLSYTVPDIDTYTPPAAGTYTGPVAGSYGGPAAGAYVSPVITPYSSVSLSPTLAAVVTEVFSVDDDLTEFEDIDVDIDNVVSVHSAKLESEYLARVAESNAQYADFGSANSRNRSIRLALLEREHSRQVAEFRAQLTYQLSLQHEQFRVQLASYRVQFEGLKLDLHKHLMAVEELKLRREVVLKDYKVLQLQEQELIMRWETLKFEDEKFKAEWERLKYLPEDFDVKYEALKYEPEKLKAQFDALKYEREKLSLQYIELKGQREALKLQRQALDVQNEDMHLKYITARINAEIDLAKTMIQTAATFVDVERGIMQTQVAFAGSVLSANELYMNSQRQFAEDTLKLNVEDALWDIKLYEFAGQALSSISGASVIPHSPNKTLEAVSGATGILGALTPLLLAAL